MMKNSPPNVVAVEPQLEPEKQFGNSVGETLKIAGDRLTSIAPGLGTLLHYRFGEDFRHDLAAGISVAAVAIPMAVAYAQLAGFNPVYGLYSSILHSSLMRLLARRDS